MAFFGGGEEVRDELVAFLTDFVRSDEGGRAADAAREYTDSVVLVLHTVDPSAAVSVDFMAGDVTPTAVADADIELQLEGDQLHNILMHRLGPVEISALIEDERIAYTGDSSKLAGLFMLAGKLQPFYPRSLERRGRRDLMDTPTPPTRRIWQVEGGYKPMYGMPRPWQRQKSPKRTAPATAA